MKIMRRFISFCILFIGLGIMGCQQGGQEQVTATTVSPADNTTATPLPTRAVQTGLTILADGQVVAVNPVLTLVFEANGRLLTIHVQPGDAVQAGDLIATLDNTALQEAVTSAELQVAQAENSLAQAQARLDELLNWEPNETAVAVAQANLIAAQAGYENAADQDAAAGNSLTSANVSLDQAQRNLTDAQEAYATAFDPGRDWELNDPFRSDQLKAEREGATRNLEYAQENLQVAQAQYSLAVAGLNNDTALNAQASVASAQQALEQAQTGPTEAEITAAQLQVEQAAISLNQSQFSLEQAEAKLPQSQLLVPWSGTILSVEAAPGAMVGAGTPIVTLLDTNRLQFHTTNVSERDLGQIQPGQPVEMVLKTYPEQPVTGTVAGIAPQASGVVGDAAVFTVMINLDVTDLVLRPGMTGRAEITDANP